MGRVIQVRRPSSLRALEEFEPVPKRIGHEEPPYPRQILRFAHLQAGLTQYVGQGRHVRDHEGRVRLPGRAELDLEAVRRVFAAASGKLEYDLHEFIMHKLTGSKG